jgi:hypothetical protein
VVFIFQGELNAQQKINREAVVRRHTIKVDKIDSLSSLSVGNGNFAFTVDATGMQSFPDAYANGVPLGTESVWGWHSFPNTENLKLKMHKRSMSWKEERYLIPYSQKNRKGQGKRLNIFVLILIVYN